MLLLFSIFIFDLVSISLSPFEFYLFLCRICCFISCLRYFIYYHFYYQLSREIFWPKNVGQRPKVSFFFLLDTSIYVLIFFIIIILYGAMFYVLLNSCFDLLSVSFNKSQTAVSLEHWGGCLFQPSWLLVALNSARNDAWVVLRILCPLQVCCGVFNFHGVYFFCLLLF